MSGEISIEQLLQLREDPELTIIDVRSPNEFAEGMIPGSINIPLFDNEERAIVGTIYKQQGIEQAKEAGLEIVSRKLPAFIKSFSQLPGPKVVYCWRGGMRSKTTATLLSLMGIRASRLTGGIRAYRRWVVASLASFQLQATPIVINGYTGTGKTKLLELMRQEGYPVVNLEELAQHRGSIFGHIGYKPHNQKTFEAQLMDRLQEINHYSHFLIEGESRRIGKVIVPEFLMQAKQAGVNIYLELPLAERVEHILADYVPSEHKAQCITAFSIIKKHLHTPVAQEIEELMKADRVAEAIELLLEYYYDPRYDHAMQGQAMDKFTIKAINVEDAAEQLKALIQEQGWIGSR